MLKEEAENFLVSKGDVGNAKDPTIKTYLLNHTLT